MGHCRQLRIDRVPEEIMSMLLESFSRQPVPLLHSIRLSTEAFTGSVIFQHPFLSLGAHRLTAVHIVEIDPSSFHFCISAFSSVTSLRLALLDISQREQYDSFRDALMNMPALTHLELGPVAVMDEPVQPTVLPNLRLLAVDFEKGSPGDLSTIISFIRAPSLNSLSLIGQVYLGIGEEIFDSLAVGENQFPALQQLVLGSDVIKACSDFRLLAKAFPNIECLTCRVENEEIADIIANITELGDELRWPKLKIIAMSKVYRTLDAEKLGNLCQLIIKLQQEGRPFHQLSYPTSGSCIALAGAEDMHNLRELVELADFRDDWPTPFEWVI
ncbi:hypothetical protein FIBSPDRAFT_934238 [Athelia psychrophila]|uniref:F-box domain-containing protein n=1 Tax=Athelia psychrophila TaxID=1759441 RepID=A0A166FMQ7_9AGAM|nr:hypothetical protein FIBSPDRAFT_934238 [Fibularhizoctonia sp. CBS 109695]